MFGLVWVITERLSSSNCEYITEILFIYFKNRFVLHRIVSCFFQQNRSPKEVWSGMIRLEVTTGDVFRWEVFTNMHVSTCELNTNDKCLFWSEQSQWCNTTWQDRWAGTCKRQSIWPTLHAEPENKHERDYKSLWVFVVVLCCVVCLPCCGKKHSWEAELTWGQNNLICWVKPQMKLKDCSLNHITLKPRERGEMGILKAVALISKDRSSSCTFYIVWCCRLYHKPHDHA